MPYGPPRPARSLTRKRRLSVITALPAKSPWPGRTQTKAQYGTARCRCAPQRSCGKSSARAEFMFMMKTTKSCTPEETSYGFTARTEIYEESSFATTKNCVANWSLGVRSFLLLKQAGTCCNKQEPELQTMARLFKNGEKMAETTRLELATSGLTGRRSNQLNYASAQEWECHSSRD